MQGNVNLNNQAAPSGGDGDVKKRGRCTWSVMWGPVESRSDSEETVSLNQAKF